MPAAIPQAGSEPVELVVRIEPLDPTGNLIGIEAFLEIKSPCSSITAAVSPKAIICQLFVSVGKMFNKLCSLATYELVKYSTTSPLK